MKVCVYETPDLRIVHMHINHCIAISFNGYTGDYSKEPGFVEDPDASDEDIDFGWR